MDHRILILGNRALGVHALHHLLTRGEKNILVVLNPDDTGVDDTGGVSLKRRVLAWGVDHIQPKGLRDDETRAILRDFKPTFGLSCSYAKIIPPDVIGMPTHGFLNVHFADLPVNRGCLPVVWTIAGGADRLTASLHEVTEGLDEGAILSKGSVPMTPGTTAGEGYAACVDIGAKLFRDFWDGYAPTGQFRSVPQDDDAATYHKMRHPYERWIPWHLDARHVADIINALTYFPHPSGRTQTPEGEEIGILGSALARADLAGQPGEVVFADNEWAVICGSGGGVTLGGLRLGDEITACETKLKTGQILTSPEKEIYTE